MKRHIPLVVVAVAVGAGSFFGGMTYAKGKPSANPAARAGRFAAGAGQMGMNRGSGGGMTAGEVIAKDERSITVKLPDGGSKLIFVSDATSVVTASSGTIADVAVGGQVMAVGQATSDGSVTASMIQIGFPGGVWGFGGLAPGGTGSPGQNPSGQPRE
jgi:hypothetical protein